VRMRTCAYDRSTRLLAFYRLRALRAAGLNRVTQWRHRQCAGSAETSRSRFEDDVNFYVGTRSSIASHQSVDDPHRLSPSREGNSKSDGDKQQISSAATSFRRGVRKQTASAIEKLSGFHNGDPASISRPSYVSMIVHAREKCGAGNRGRFRKTAEGRMLLATR